MPFFLAFQRLWDDKHKTNISAPFPELYFWICTQGIKVQQKYKIMFNQTRKKTQCLCTILINNKDSFLNISHIEVLIVYISGYTLLGSVVFIFTKGVCFHQRNWVIFQNHNCYTCYSFLNFQTQYKINLFSAVLHTRLIPEISIKYHIFREFTGRWKPTSTT